MNVITMKVVKLSPREKEIVTLVCQEFTAKEIAHELGIAETTVITHMYRLRNKLNVRNMAGLVREVLLHDLVDREVLLQAV